MPRYRKQKKNLSLVRKCFSPWRITFLKTRKIGIVIRSSTIIVVYQFNFLLRICANTNYLTLTIYLSDIHLPLNAFRIHPRAIICHDVPLEIPLLSFRFQPWLFHFLLSFHQVSSSYQTLKLCRLPKTCDLHFHKSI